MGTPARPQRGTGAAGPGGGAGLGLGANGRYRIPASAHALAYALVQIWLALTKPSLMTVSSMLSFVIATVSSSTDGTCLRPLSTRALAMSGAFLPCASGTASSAAVSAIFVIGW